MSGGIGYNKYKIWELYPFDLVLVLCLHFLLLFSLLPDFPVSRPFFSAHGGSYTSPLLFFVFPRPPHTRGKSLIYVQTQIVTRYVFPHAWSSMSVAREVSPGTVKLCLMDSLSFRWRSLVLRFGFRALWGTGYNRPQLKLK